MNTEMNPYYRYPHTDGYAGYRIPKQLDDKLKALSAETGLSKLHLLEVAVRQFVQKPSPLEW